ncbi:MAG TPA: DciA family protein [Vicinamibacterales bacterium]|nr:DciA family protein [Vicinamibacterales bacterium]
MTPAHLLMPGALAAILRKTPLTPEKVAFAWRAAVGPAVDNATTIDLRQDVLYVRARDAVWEREVERSAPLIRSRLKGLLGEHVVRFIRVTQ